MHIIFGFFVDSDTNSHNEEVPRLSGNAVVITRGDMSYQVSKVYNISYILAQNQHTVYLISLINVKSRLPNLKNSPLHKKKSPLHVY